MITADRRSLADLLLRWQAGEVSAWQMIGEAEEAEGLLVGDKPVVPPIPRADPQSIPIAVLELVATAHHQPLLPSDVPALIEFLETGAGRELEAWARFDRYCKGVDWAGRESAAQALYFTPERLDE